MLGLAKIRKRTEFLCSRTDEVLPGGDVVVGSISSSSKKDETEQDKSRHIKNGHPVSKIAVSAETKALNRPGIVIGDVLDFTAGQALHLAMRAHRGRNEADLDQLSENKMAGGLLVLRNELAHSFSFNCIQRERGRLIC